MKLVCRLVACALALVPVASGQPETAPVVPGDYVGEYTRSDGVPVYVAERAGEMVVVVAGSVFALAPSGPDRFALVGVPEAVRFERGADARVVAVSDSQGSYPRVSSTVPAEIAALVGGAPADYSYAPPQPGEPGLPVGDATAHGLPAAAVEAVMADVYGDPDYRHVRALLVQKDGVLVVEEYVAGVGPDQTHNVRSATKSVVSALVGAAVRRGEVGLGDRPFAVVAQAEGRPISAHKASLTLADLLDMRHGLQCDDWDPESPGNEARIYGEPDWLAVILSIPDGAERDGPSYCSAVPLVVGRYLELATGQPLAAFADTALFGPLGVARDDWEWDVVLAARETMHGAQVHLRPRDMVRFGALYVRGGRTPEGERLLPEGWVGAAFDATMPLGDWRRYSDFWWTYDVPRDGADPVTVHTASGVGGQRIAVVPALDLVVVLTGASFSEGRSGPTRIIERIVQAVEP